MKLARSLPMGALALAAALALALTVTVEAASVKDDLAHYFPIRAALAADKTDGVKEHAEALAKSDDAAVAKAAAQVAHVAGDLKSARKAFGDLSKAMIAAAERAAKDGADLGTVYVFECPMARPYGKWLQETDAIANPYYGSEMRKCGMKVGTIGGGKSEK